MDELKKLMQEGFASQNDTLQKIINIQEEIKADVEKVKTDVLSAKTTADNNEQEILQLKNQIASLKIDQQDTRRRGSRR